MLYCPQIAKIGEIVIIIRSSFSAPFPTSVGSVVCVGRAGPRWWAVLLTVGLGRPNLYTTVVVEGLTHFPARQDIGLYNTILRERGRSAKGCNRSSNSKGSSFHEMCPYLVRSILKRQICEKTVGRE